MPRAAGSARRPPLGISHRAGSQLVERHAATVKLCRFSCSCVSALRLQRSPSPRRRATSLRSMVTRAVEPEPNTSLRHSPCSSALTCLGLCSATRRRSRCCKRRQAMTRSFRGSWCAHSSPGLPHAPHATPNTFVRCRWPDPRRPRSSLSRRRRRSLAAALPLQARRSGSSLPSCAR